MRNFRSEVFGVTFKRLSRKPWELPYVSVIDCRLDKKYRSYYTKWHELGHLLILTDQMRLAFRRTHFGLDDKDPEEALVDVIAGAFGFLPDLIKPVAKGRPSFEVDRSDPRATLPRSQPAGFNHWHFAGMAYCVYFASGPNGIEARRAQRHRAG